MFFEVAKVLVRVFMRIYFRVSISGEENIPKDGGVMLCMNHYSLWEPAVISAFMKRRVYFVAKEELFDVFGLGWILKNIGTVPIKRGRGDIGAIKASMSVIEDGRVLGIFPSGKRVKPGEDASVKSGVSLIATKTGAAVVPVYIESKYRPFSKVRIVIGKKMDFSKYKGTKVPMEDINRLSSDIYKNIIALSEV